MQMTLQVSLGDSEHILFQIAESSLLGWVTETIHIYGSNCDMVRTGNAMTTLPSVSIVSI